MDEDLLRFTVGLVRAAGQLAAARFAVGPPLVATKADGSEVTPADVEVEQLLRARIAERFPADAVVGEEEGETPGTTGRRWVLDPVDGTSLFARGIPVFGVQVAVEDADGPGIAVVGQPVTDEVWSAGRGLGCWRQLGDGRPVRVRVGATSRLRGATVEMVNPMTWSTELLTTLHREVLLLPALKGPLGVVAGLADATVAAGFPMGYEDRAVLPLLVGEAGGRVSDLSGSDVLTGDGSVLVSNGRLHDELLDLLDGIPHGRDHRRLLTGGVTSGVRWQTLRPCRTLVRSTPAGARAP